MQLKERDGISCDHCGTTYKTDFVYYSFDFRLLSVIDNRRPSLSNIFRTNVVFSLDFCTACFEKIKGTIVEKYQSTMTPDFKKRGKRAIMLTCDLTGEKLLGTFNYYHCNVIKVDVRMSGQANVCVSCHATTNDSEKPCEKCGSLDFLRPALISTDDRYVEINVSEKSYHELVNKAETIRKVAGEWVTKS